MKNTPSKIVPNRSILPNSSPEILQPLAGNGGTFQVKWFAEADTHGLLFKQSGMVQLLATHHNGYSCHALAKRIISGDMEHATQQLQFIQDCGGTVIKSLDQFASSQK